MIELKGIRKYFRANGVYALDNAGFELRPGEIHALLGENGAGKSTLMQVMAGYLRPNAGSVFVEGKRRRFSSPSEALASGVGMVRQHPHPAPGFKVWEDCTLGAERKFFLHPAKARKRAVDLSERWGFDLPMDSLSESLTVSQRQKAAVLALLLKGVRWLIFDEPGAVLSPGEAAALFDLFTRLRDEGKGVVIISHKLDEAMGLADRVTVIRRGKTLSPRKAASLSTGELRELIFGPDGTVPAGKVLNTAAADAAAGPAETLLLVRDLKVEIPGRPFIRNISLELRRGEILGVTGVRDSGLETLELALTGFLGIRGMGSDPGRGTDPGGRGTDPGGMGTDPGGRGTDPAEKGTDPGRGTDPGGKGTDPGGMGTDPGKGTDPAGPVRLNGRDVSDVRSFREAGGAYLGADRLGVNLAPELPLRESLIIHAWRRSRLGLLGKAGIMNTKFLDAHCRAIMNRAGISRSPKNRGATFSGGMLQRILLSRELEENASILVLAEPGWGLDQAGRIRMAEELKACAASGRGVLLFSTDVDELLSLCGEIVVLLNGAVSTRVVLGKGLSAAEAKAEIGRAMIGSSAKEESGEF
jgi:simple sugar transport system ATP-binding protein